MTKAMFLALALGMTLFSLPACNGHSHAESDVTTHRHAVTDDEIVQAHVTADGYYFDDDECSSAVTCTSEFVGDVIALPFRVVASVVDFVF